ncbi:MAG: sodium:solute symporter family protein [Eubacteriaceae bacterium]|nr:sodium:solute symporter family protein [Eubacteriaceae bacterium]
MTIALIIVIIYMFSLLFVSWWSTKRQKEGGSNSFLFADQMLNKWLIAVMIAGLAVGGASTIGVAQKAYTGGMSAGWYDAAWAAGALFSGIFLAQKIRNSTFKTVNEMWGRVFGEGFRTLSVIIQFCILLVIVALQIVAGGAVLTALLPQYFTMPIALIVSAAMFLLIAVVGGLWAASLSNIINMIVIYVGIILGVIAAIKGFGGLASINAALPAGISGDGSHWYNLFSGMGYAVVLAWFVTMILQASPNATIIQTTIAAKNPKEARSGVILAAIMMIPAGFISAMFGIIAAAKFPGLANSALALPSVVTAAIPPVIAGFLLSGLWAADVSTATGLMVSLGTMGTKDIVVKYFAKNMSDKKQLVLSRWLIVLCAIAAYILATKVTSVLSALMAALTMFAPYAILMTAMFVFPKTVKKSSAWMTFIVGGIFFILSQFFVKSLAIAHQPIYTVFIVSIVTFILCAVFDKKPAPVNNLYKKDEELAEKAS